MPTLASLASILLAALLLKGACCCAQDVSTLTHHESPRYRLSTDAPEQTAHEYLKVLEAAWPQLQGFFGKAPKMRKNERLPICFFDTREAWEQRLTADKVAIPTGSGGYYWPGNRTVYLWKQPTIYTSRQLLLHEAMHQFHFLACCNNVAPKDGWYVEGVVEHLSRHHWDGESLRLGVVPLCSLEDFPRHALDLFERNDFDLTEIIENKRPGTRPEQWALVHYMVTGENGTLGPKWDRLRQRLDAGQHGKSSFRSIIGNPKAVQVRIKDWLKDQQEPFVPVWNEWWGTGVDSVQGTATVTSALRLRNDASMLEATLIEPETGPWKGGLLIAFTDTDNYCVVQFDSQGGYSVNLRKDNSWQILKSGPAASPRTKGKLALKAERSTSGIRVIQDGVEVGVFALPGGKLGVCLENCTLRFADLISK